MKAIGLLEFNSIAVGIRAADAMAKAASVEMLEATSICPGKYAVLVAGDVASVGSSVDAGAAEGREFVVDRLLLPSVHPEVFPAITCTTQVKTVDALGIIETLSVASAIVAADAARKAAEVTLIEIRLAKGLGGKAFVTLTGDVSAVEAAVSAGAATASDRGMLVARVVIPGPHEHVKRKIL